jgi:hypothetical protein
MEVLGLSFPYSVISMACFGNAYHKITVTAKVRFRNRNHLSEMPTIRPSGMLTSAVKGQRWAITY